MSKVLPPVTRDDRLAALRQAMELAQTQGVTSVQNAGVSVDDFALYDELRKQGELDLRVYNAISAVSGLSDAEVTKFEAVRTEFADDPVLKAGAVKLMLDGVVESYTAAMLEPYANRATLGQTNFTQAELDRVVALLDKRGWQIFIHAIGDRGIRSALDAFEHAARANPPAGPRTPAPHRAHRDHRPGRHPALRRARRHRLAAALPRQPGAQSDRRLEDQPRRAARQPFVDVQQPARWRRAHRVWQRLAGRAARPAPGPARRDDADGADGVPDGGWVPSERLTLAQAIDGYTSAGAWASFDEQRKGTLAPGMLADIVILTSDIFEPGAKLLDAHVALTIFDGRIVFDREQVGKTE